jgi:hypothetical protein
MIVLILGGRGRSLPRSAGVALVAVYAVFVTVALR